MNSYDMVINAKPGPPKEIRYDTTVENSMVTLKGTILHLDPLILGNYSCFSIYILKLAS